MPSPAQPENAFPRSRNGRIRWALQREGNVILDAARLGVPQEQADAFSAAAKRAEAKNLAYASLRSRAKAAGVEAQEAETELTRLAGLVISNVRRLADNSANPAEVLAIAEIDAVQPRTPSGPPASPTAVKPTLQNDGSVQIGWTGRTASTAFTVQRQLTAADGAAGPWSDVVPATGRPAVDPGLPAGTTAASYRVRAVRSGLLSAWSVPGSITLAAGTATPSALKIAA